MTTDRKTPETPSRLHDGRRTVAYRVPLRRRNTEEATSDLRLPRCP